MEELADRTDAEYDWETWPDMTRLNPSGRVEIEGRTYEAQARDGFLEAGVAVTVLAHDNFKLIIESL